MIRQELNPETCRLETKHQKQLLPIMNNAGTFTRVPGGCLRWPPTPPGPRWPPALFFELERERTKEEKEREEVLHLFRCYTHTHLAGARSTLKGKRKKKADTRRADGQNQRKGGKGNRRTSKTNLHGETDLTKTAHTPKPHDTLRRGTRGELGTKWGTS